MSEPPTDFKTPYEKATLEQDLKYKRSDYLYDRAGPWPQPSPHHPFTAPAQVLNIPKEEKRDWMRWVGLRYLRTMAFGWFESFHFANTNPRVADLNDEFFTRVMTDGMFSKFLSPTPKVLEESDRGGPEEAIFDSFSEFYETSDADDFFLRSEFTAMECLEPWEGFYTAPSVVLWKQKGEDVRTPKEAVAIRINGLVVQPGDGDAWELAKVFAMQGAAYETLFVKHPLMHFPFDSVNAITKTAVPKKHLLFKIIYPHTRVTLTLNDAVQQSNDSVIAETNSVLYGPFGCARSKGLLDMFPYGFTGIVNAG